ncbi:MAG: class I SAM-dependent methyltransferase [Vicinamibacterales bacterium]
MTDTIRFDDGAAYERYMGVWSQCAGEVFLDWLAPDPGLRWLDVGCGNGAFTEMLVQRCAPSSVDGLDPSAEQLAYARTRPALSGARLHQGDAMSQPFPDHSFDVAVIPLAIFFLSEPSRGVAEMARVVAPEGIVSGYAWDMTGGGFPYDALVEEMRALGTAVARPPTPEASRLDALHALWTENGLNEIETREIHVRRVFTDFDEYWTIICGSPSAGPRLRAMTAQDAELLKSRLRDRLQPGRTGRIECTARANAVKGRVPLDGPS